MPVLYHTALTGVLGPSEFFADIGAAPPAPYFPPVPPSTAPNLMVPDNSADEVPPTVISSSQSQPQLQQPSDTATYTAEVWR